MKYLYKKTFMKYLYEMPLLIIFMNYFYKIPLWHTFIKYANICLGWEHMAVTRRTDTKESATVETSQAKVRILTFAVH